MTKTSIRSHFEHTAPLPHILCDNPLIFEELTGKLSGLNIFYHHFMKVKSYVFYVTWRILLLRLQKNR